MSGWRRSKHTQDKWLLQLAAANARSRRLVQGALLRLARISRAPTPVRRAHGGNAHVPAHRAIWSSPTTRYESARGDAGRAHLPCSGKRSRETCPPLPFVASTHRVSGPSTGQGSAAFCTSWPGRSGASCGDTTPGCVPTGYRPRATSATALLATRVRGQGSVHAIGEGGLERRTPTCSMERVRGSAWRLRS